MNIYTKNLVLTLNSNYNEVYLKLKARVYNQYYTIRCTTLP